jgi:hypothetical protein
MGEGHVAPKQAVVTRIRPGGDAGRRALSSPSHHLLVSAPLLWGEPIELRPSPHEQAAQWTQRARGVECGGCGGR